MSEPAIRILGGIDGPAASSKPSNEEVARAIKILERALGSEGTPEHVASAAGERRTPGRPPRGRWWVKACPPKGKDGRYWQLRAKPPTGSDERLSERCDVARATRSGGTHRQRATYKRHSVDLGDVHVAGLIGSAWVSDCWKRRPYRDCQEQT